jgi:hypothetical protein
MAYGANALHLLAMLCSLALAGYAAVRTASDSRWPLMLVWFVGALIVHDLLLFPLYTIADRSLIAAIGSLRRRRQTPAFAVPPLNYLRIPGLGAALTFLIYFPGIIRQGASTYHDATGQTQTPFLARWLLLCAVMFGVSAIAYAIQAGRVARSQRPS